MIGTILQFVARQLNQFICRRLQLDTGQRKIVLASHVSADGTFSGSEDNMLLLCLAGIRKDTVAKRSPVFPEAQSPGSSGGTQVPAFLARQPPVHLNLQLVIAANFREEQMQSGLDLLSLAILMLQSSPVWDAKSFPEMPDGIGNFVFEMETLTNQEQSHLWSTLGAKYLPSIVYKLRMLTLDDRAIQAVVPGVQLVEGPGR